MNNKYIRVLACSLNAISLLLVSTAKCTEKNAQIVTVLQPLVQNPDFWKMAKNKQPLVRTSVFHCTVQYKYSSSFQISVFVSNLGLTGSQELYYC